MSLQVLAKAETALEGVLATRYLSVAGLTVLLYDHLLTFEQERRYLWPSKASVIKYALLLNRYLVAIVLSINGYALSGLNSAGLSNSFCQIWWTMIPCLAIFSIAICHGILILKLWKLWGASRLIILVTTAAYIVTETVSLIMVGVTAKNIWPHAIYVPQLQSCALTVTPPTLKVVWATMVIFELFAFLMVLFNGLSRPRSGDSALFKILIHDGIYFFLVISALGWLNLVTSTVSPGSKGELGVFCIWALCVTIVTRMILNLREAETKRQPIQDAIIYGNGGEEGLDSEGSGDYYELYYK